MVANLTSIIKEQREELENIEKREQIIKRDFLKQAEKFLIAPNVLAITGVRRCGKSIFSYLLFKNKKFGYINFDDERLADLKKEQLDEVLGAFYQLYGDVSQVILDEVQNIEGWELFVNRLRRTKKVIITGSNSKLLAGELADRLTGRHLGITLYPFSFKEFLDFFQFQKDKVYTTKEKAGILNLLNKYFEIGGFPEAYKFGKAMLAQIYEDIIAKDIVLRYKLRKVNEIKSLARYLMSNFCSEVSYRKLAHLLEVKQPATLSKWFGYLEQSFLFFQLPRFSFKFKEQLIAPRKIYCIDNGLINVIAFRFSQDVGRFMENTAAVELQRRKAENTITEVFYWKNHQHNEVDFLIKKQTKIAKLIQVSYANNFEDIKEREIKSLLLASQELKCSNLLVITSDFTAEKKIQSKTIKFIPLWKWLLQ